MRKIALLVWLAAFAPAHAAPFDLHQKTGVLSEVLHLTAKFPCELSTGGPHPTILDGIDESLAASREVAGGCVVAEVKFAGFFSPDEPAADALSEAPGINPLLTGCALTGFLLLFSGFAMGRIRARRLQGPVVRRRVEERRPMAWI